MKPTSITSNPEAVGMEEGADPGADVRFGLSFNFNR